MSPKDLRDHKRTAKELSVHPTFKQLRRGRLPKPFNRMGGSRLYATDVIDLSEVHCAVFMWRDGEILTDRAFFGHLLYRLSTGAFYPLFEFHWHPSHKGLHAKLPCRTDLDYTNRMLPGAPEFQMSSRGDLDPRKEEDRSELITEFCRACGVTVVKPDDPKTRPLWN